MGYPTASEIGKHVLNLLKDQKMHDLKEVKELVSKNSNLTEEELKKVSSQKKRLVYDTKVIAALTSLRKKGLIVNERTGVFKITKEGLKEVKQR